MASLYPLRTLLETGRNKIEKVEGKIDKVVPVLFY
jgi:hypothetical protein